MKKSFAEKFKSRKFLAALSGVLIGVGLIVGGETTEGAVTVLTAILGYLAAEGYVDAKAVKNAAETASAVSQGVLEEINDEHLIDD